METNNNSKEEENFAALFEGSLFKVKSLEPGQLVETQIVSISKDCIFLQWSGKSEGVLDKEELTDKEGNLSVKIGDTIKVFFLNNNNNGEMRFTTKITGESASAAMLENAFKNRIPVEGVVEKEIKGGYEVKIGEIRAFCPYSQMGPRRTENTGAYVGKHLTFIIKEYKENSRNITVSNRAIEEENHQDQIESLKKTLKENTVITGTIKSIQDFGAFIDVNGVQALLPVSEISRDRVEDIKKVLTVGQEIEAMILKIDWKTERITLSMKSLLLDPWAKAMEKYPKGSKITGKVVRITDFGAFVSLESGLDGLIHISEFKGDSKYSNSGIPVKVGETVSVQILEIDPGKKRIALKPASTVEEDETSKKYLDRGTDTDTYNPFAALLKKK